MRNRLGICTHCLLEKPLSEFSRDKRSAFGLRPECKKCERRRGSYYIKHIRGRIKQFPQYYGNIQLLVTSNDIENIPDVCYFCNEPIEDSLNIHRIDHTGNYTIQNIVKVHKICHAKFGGHNNKPNPSKGFGSMNKEKARMIQLKGNKASQLIRKKVDKN